MSYCLCLCHYGSTWQPLAITRNGAVVGVVFTASGTSPKMRNIARDPRVSVAMYAPLVGQASSRGAQLFGRARVLTENDPDFAGYWSVVRWQSDHVERSLPLEEPPLGPIGVVEADRIVYTEHWLRRDGYAPRQVWQRHPTPSSTT